MHTCFTLQTHLVMFKVTSLENTEEHTWKRHCGICATDTRIPAALSEVFSQSNFQPLLHMHMKATGIRS